MNGCSCRRLWRQNAASTDSAARDGGSYNVVVFLMLVAIALTSCAPFSLHRFLGPSRDWETRSGQLMYRDAKRTLIGDVIVRSSKSGEFEMTFSKGPGVTLFTIQQDANFAHVKGALARMGWSGPVDRAPKQLRGWLGLREKLIQSLATASPSGGGQDRQVVRHVAGAETFLFRF